ncbi:Crp/Fnr family transcriptional regulator [Flagellimonas myxillae]|uniref:Crp/Fnr family transcriptional regulator n=1 Tax=Flagellimonas myxillae TaxID=2942214 RepID=UPI00201F8213|nr:Crp/Fnr family transcriptional regulator [Muricauda myxillae]MCL6267464.1 Crp/Fnr family transcriptional regulator [Muricauda myxillae]
MLNESIHSIEKLNKEDYFLEFGKPCSKIGKIEEGVLRGFVYDQDGNEVTTHFYQEGDMVVGSFLPNTKMNMSIQAMMDCRISIANYAEVMSWVNKDPQITEIITREFQKLNHQLQSRLVSLLNLTSLEKYKRFLEDYPGLLNRIPHYYIANYLGITPTQLSRARKQFSQQM